MTDKTIKVLLADDHRIFRDGIASMFRGSEAISITGMASNGVEVLGMMDTLKPDVIVLDISMPVMGGFELLRKIRNIDNRPLVLILSMHSDIAYVTEALAAGANGYICKEDTSKDELIEAVKSITTGETYFGRSVKQQLEKQFVTGATSVGKQNGAQPGPEVLSKRETEVLRMVMEGLSNQEIADATYVSIRTVETHKTNIMTKLNIKNTVELVKYVIRHKFFEI